MPTRLISYLLLLIIMTGCGSSAHTPRGTKKGKNEMKYAQRLRMYKQEGYTLVEIVDDTPAKNIESSFILLPENVKAPAADPNVTVIPTPVTKALVYTSVHAGGLAELGQIKSVTGVADAEYFKIPAITKGLNAGTIKNIGASSSPSAEKIIELAPQVIIVNQYQGADYHVIDKLGIPLIKMAENLEQTPLGRAEWLKFLGELTGEREKADSIFNEVETRYLALQKEGTTLTTHPKVLTESIYEGVWNVPGGASYQANLLKDAGSNYPWASTTQTGSIPLAYEQVLEKASDADVWLINVYGYDLSKKKLLDSDSRYGYFNPVKSGNVWFCNTAESPIFEETPYHPDLILADYLSIISGKGDNLRYFKKMSVE